MGNLLAIPIENSILYVQPLYLESTVSGTSIPQFARVIVALGDQIVMDSSLSRAIARLTGGPAPPAAESPTVAPGPIPAPSTAAPPALAPAPPKGDTKTLVRQAGEEFQKAQQAQRKGDWAEYGAEIKRLEQTLNELQKRSR